MTPPPWGTPISLQLIFVLPFAHFEPLTFSNEGVMVPIHITLKTTSNSSHQRLKPTICSLPPYSSDLDPTSLSPAQRMVK
jgi:hypothetical protein